MRKQGLTARITISDCPVSPLFERIAREGHIPPRDMYNTFNMGIGLVLAVDPSVCDGVVKALEEMGEKAYVIGKVTDKEGVEL